VLKSLTSGGYLADWEILNDKDKSEKVRGHKDGINYRHQTDIDENAVDD
jgi:hypothetical protein